MNSRCEGCLTRHCNGCWVDISRNSTIHPKPIKKKININTNSSPGSTMHFNNGYDYSNTSMYALNWWKIRTGGTGEK